MCDFSPLIRRPIAMLFGAAAQFGIFATIVIAAMLGFNLKQAAAIGIIGAADGPTTIYVATRFAQDMLGRSRSQRIPTWRWCRSSSRR
jgi:Na+-transporting methylmalonyl-CoA/oxaloacetate decarboxylase, beta subunit